MARPRKADLEKAKPREIHVADAVWSAIRTEAAAADLSVSQYLIRCRDSSPRPCNPTHLIHLIEELQKTHRALERVADGLSGANKVNVLTAHLPLISIERRLAQILADATP